MSICLDMLYEAQRYDECAKLATDVLNIKEAKDLLSNAVLELAIVACFKVVSFFVIFREKGVGCTGGATG